MAKIRPAQLDDISLYHEHSRRHGMESGRDGDLIFAPFQEPQEPDLESFSKSKMKYWQQPVTEPGWQRAWVLIDFEQIFGSLELVQQPAMDTGRHRATLMMGIERSHRGQGWGSRLTKEALAWAKNQDGLDWIDLNVFAHNEGAHRLYKRLGFQEVGRVADQFRVHGQSIENVRMTLRV